MDKKLLQHFSKFGSLSTEEIFAIDETMEEKRFKKGEILIREGQISSQVFFVLDGLVRQYYLVAGEEKTLDFFEEGRWVLSATNVAPTMPSPHFLECSTDCVLLVGSSVKGEALYQKYPKLGDISRKLMESVFVEQRAKLEKFLTSDPQERYLLLLKNNPDLPQRVPQYQIASYIGVTPESLSRIRKRLAS